MIRRARRCEDSPLPPPPSQAKPCVRTWRDQEYKAGRPSGLLDYYRAHAICIACLGNGLDASPDSWDHAGPPFKPCKLCRGSGELKIF